MNINKEVALKIVETLLAIVVLGAVFQIRAAQNLNSKNQAPDHSSNFFTFWLAGRMVLTGENPYDETQYLAGHDAFDVAWKPNKIFPYPLPLSLFMIPLGALSLPDAFFAWQLVSQIIVAVTVYILLERWQNPALSRLLAPIVIFLLYFGPVYLTLQVGSIGALTLLIMLVSILLFEKEKSLLAGAVLSLTMLKPPQGLTILLLAGVWFLARKDWKAMQGVILGGFAILVVGMIQDPLWVFKFREASQAVMERTQGIQSNVWAYSYLFCDGSSPCSEILGGISASILLGLGGLFLWRNQARLSAWEAFNVVIPVGFVSTIYLWAYDQILYVIPIVWVVGALTERTKKYFHAFVFLITATLVSFAATILHAYTLKDIWNLGNTLVALGMVLGLYYLKQKEQSQT